MAFAATGCSDGESASPGTSTASSGGGGTGGGQAGGGGTGGVGIGGGNENLSFHHNLILDNLGHGVPSDRGTRAYSNIGGQRLMRSRGGQLTSEPLWPFPNEEWIREDLLTVPSASGPSARGLTAYQSPFGSPSTLTAYVWEYLGSACPDEICSP